MDHQQEAASLFLNGYSCSQAVFAAFAPDMGISQDMALKLASSFGGGMGGLRETCGAVTGMLMVLGALQGYNTANDLPAKTAHYARVRGLIEQFRQEHSTIVCRDLLAHLKTLQTQPSARTEQYYKERPCVLFVRTAARLLDESLCAQNAAE